MAIYALKSMICNCIIYDYIRLFKYNLTNISTKTTFEDGGRGGGGGANVLSSPRVGPYNFRMPSILVCVLSYILITGTTPELPVGYSGKGGGGWLYTFEKRLIYMILCNLNVILNGISFQVLAKRFMQKTVLLNSTVLT